MNDARPICAIATPSGRGGIGIVRASGKGIAKLVESVCGRLLPARQASYLPFLDADGGTIDQGIAIWFPAPHSYTGEDVLELQGHGGPVVMQMLLARVLAAGAPLGLRLAAPGEFTERAYLNDKLDLAQAEAVADLIDASTEQAARSAQRSMSGEFSQRVHGLRDGLIELRMLVEATLDFPEEEIDFLERADAEGKLRAVRESLAATLAVARTGALLRDGLNVVLVGEPNVGKSSLLNALAGAEVAIVTPIAGTTRDRVAQAIQIEGVPINIIDTAGLRESSDEVERIGIARTWDEIGRADVVLLLGVAEPGPEAPADPPLAAEVLERTGPRVPVVHVWNKIDLAGLPAASRGEGTERGVWLSARTGEGIDGLRHCLLELAGWQGAGESQFIARERHLVALREASGLLDEAVALGWREGQGLELFAEELRLAQEALGAITGEFSADELLGVIFSRFCIGK
ncbi:MAG: tRNA uridine-5-carboxymethylaminomethyl(34) synthesis GTPase MnmE [Burkholderiaceae bacterium]|nr:tRNA uridine-5-carboxymethylaminomethyl(34) synthesis GTPase MnmE [Burkholderiaceae bacterium]MEB2319485.1 tRNA uridine-5-carboxymethylaminomethyl(34) synthesis GTPase MnmE [Pseudomonadota bacterium]